MLADSTSNATVCAERTVFNVGRSGMNAKMWFPFGLKVWADGDGDGRLKFERVIMDVLYPRISSDKRLLNPLHVHIRWAALQGQVALIPRYTRTLQISGTGSSVDRIFALLKTRNRMS